MHYQCVNILCVLYFIGKRNLGEKNMLKDKLALIEEYREWIVDGILEDNALYLIDKR